MDEAKAQPKSSLVHRSERLRRASVLVSMGRAARRQGTAAAHAAARVPADPPLYGEGY